MKKTNDIKYKTIILACKPVHLLVVGAPRVDSSGLGRIWATLKNDNFYWHPLG